MENPTNCAECGAEFNTTTHRLVKESCGHEKCRQCLLLASDGCPQCAVEEEIVGADEEEEERAQQPDGAIWIKGDIEDDAGKLEVAASESEEHQGLDVIYEYNEGEEYVSQEDVYESEIIEQTEVEEEEEGEEMEHGEVYEEVAVRQRKTKSIKTAAPGGKTSRVISGSKDEMLPPHIVKLEKEEDSKGKPQYQCLLCAKTISRSAVSYHVYCSPDIEMPFGCKHCEKRFRTADHLRYHTASHGPQVDLICEVCEKKFKNKTTLSAHHRQMHSTTAAHVCGDCGKHFISESRYKVHARIHTNSFPFSCSECGREFRFKENLMKHIKITHSDERPFHCEHCDIGFKRNGAYKSHMARSHSNGPYPAKPITCPDCNKTFTHHTLLARHRKTHTDVRLLYKCEKCDSECSRKDNVIRHIRMMHFDGDMNYQPKLGEDWTMAESSVVEKKPGKRKREVYGEVDYASIDEEELDVGEEEVDPNDVIEEEVNDENVEEMELTHDDSAYEDRKSTVIIYVGAKKSDANLRGSGNLTGRRVTRRPRPTKDTKEKFTISSDKLEIYRKILIPSKEEYIEESGQEDGDVDAGTS